MTTGPIWMLKYQCNNGDWSGSETLSPCQQRPTSSGTQGIGTGVGGRGCGKQNARAGVMSENIMMSKIAHFCTFLCAILTNSVCNSYMLTKYIILDAKIAHSPLKLCAIL